MVEYCQSVQSTYSGYKEQNAVGNVITSSNPVILKEVTAMTGYLREPETGTIYARVYNSSGVFQKEFGYLDASTLTSVEEPHTFTLPSGSHEVAVGDRFVFEADFSTSGPSETAVATSGPYTGWERIEFKDGSWETPTATVAVKMCLLAGSASAGGTFIPPPPAYVRL